ncbi:hypothetical protein BDW62DRAFT_176714 [Aspergillus aurantiobrunneus]
MGAWFALASVLLIWYIYVHSYGLYDQGDSNTTNPRSSCQWFTILHANIYSLKISRASAMTAFTQIWHIYA